MYGTQAYAIQAQGECGFENDVNMYGTQALVMTYAQVDSLRMM